MTKLWAKREEQIRRVIDTPASMYGDLRGITGQSLQEVDSLSLKSQLDPAAAGRWGDSGV